MQNQSKVKWTTATLPFNHLLLYATKQVLCNELIVFWPYPGTTKMQDEDRPLMLKDKIKNPKITLVMIRILWFYSHRCWSRDISFGKCWFNFSVVLKLLHAFVVFFLLNRKYSVLVNRFYCLIEIPGLA